MATMHGADIAQLRQLAAQFDAKAQALDANRMTVGNAIQVSAWVGPVAVRFRHTWESDYSRKLHDAASRLRDAATSLRANADDQERTSAVDAGGGVGGSGGGFVDHDAEHKELGPAPTSTAGIYHTLHGMDGTDGVRIQVVRGDDGQERIIVYINGTGADSDGRFSLGANLTLMAGGETQSLAYVRELLRDAAAAHPGAEVMLAGYSQGGIVAQRLAQEGDFNVSTVVTFGSPRLPDSRLGDVDVVRLEHNGDGIPSTDGEGALTGLVDATNAANAQRAGGSDGVFRGGNFFQGGGQLGSVAPFIPGNDNAHFDQGDYSWLSDQFDSSTRSVDVRGQNALRRFGGVVVDDKQ